MHVACEMLIVMVMIIHKLRIRQKIMTFDFIALLLMTLLEGHFTELGIIYETYTS